MTVPSVGYLAVSLKTLNMNYCSSESIEKINDNGVILIPNSLRVVCQAIDKGCESFGSYSDDSDFSLLLETLNYIERSCIANYFCKLPWNVASVKILGSLNRLRILTATEFILSQTDDEHIQLVLNDFLETEFDLMANLVITGHYDLMIGSKISEYIAESMRRLLIDLGNNPNLNNLDYLNSLSTSVPKELYFKFVTNHLRIILSMHKRSAKIAFACFFDWTRQNLDDYVLLNNFYKKAVFGNEINLVKSLLSISTGENFSGWKNYLILLALIAKNAPTESYFYIKKFLKDRLHAVAEKGSTEIMAHLLISIRIVLMFSTDKTDTYEKWYKQHIGKMKFVFSVTEFKTMMAVLTDLLSYEVDEEYIEIHARASISPPAMCSQLCRDYKLLCRTRISDLGDCSRMMDNDNDLFSDVG